MAERQVWKFNLGLIGRYVTSVPVAIPSGARLLSVGIQEDQMMLWALVDPPNKPVAREFMIIGTGVPSEALEARAPQFIGTVQHNGYVWHVFELTAFPLGGR